MLKDAIRPAEALQSRAMKILGEVSFGLDIILVETTALIQPGPSGPQMVWGIIFFARGALIGHEHNVANMSYVGNPWIEEEELRNLLSAGCASLREKKAAQMRPMNGGS